MQRLIFTGLLIFFSACITMAQVTERGRITGKITDEQLKPIDGITAELLRAKDSSLAKAAISDKTGLVEFESIPFGSYFIRISTVHFEKLFTPVIILSSDASAFNVADIVLKPTSKELQSVVVTGRKPFIQQMTDRIIVNVENSVINAGSSA